MARTKNILLFVLVMVLSLVLIGCSPREEEPEEEVEVAEEVLEEKVSEPEEDEEELEEEDEEEEKKPAEVERSNGQGTDSTFDHQVEIRTNGEIREGDGEEWWKEEGNNGEQWWKND